MKLETGCLGMCESYEVAVYADGFVDYRGRAYVKHGRHTAKLTPAQLAELDAVFAGFAAIDGDEIHCNVTDLGQLYTIRYRGTRISFFELCDRVPDVALEIVGGIRATLGLERWFGTARERARLPEWRR